MNTNEPKEFKEFTSKFSNDDLQNNYKVIVKEFSINENTEKKRKVKPPMMINNQPIISYFSLEQYIEMANECLSEPLANKEDVIQTLLQKYINNPLKKVESNCSKIYHDIKAGQNNHYFVNPFSFYSNLIAIEELIKFENYLLNELKNEAQQNTGKKIKPKKAIKTLFDFIHNVKNKETFMADLKNTFNTESGIDFKIMIELLKAERILLIGDRHFAGFYRVIKPFFNSNIGSQNGLNDLYKHTEDEQTIHSKKIEVINEKLKPLITKHKL